MKEVVAVILQNDHACVYWAVVENGIWELDSEPVAVFPNNVIGKQDAKLFAEKLANEKFGNCYG